MTDDAKQIITNSLCEIHKRFGVKASIIICFEDGKRTILVAGKTLELCNAVESVAKELHESWEALDKFKDASRCEHSECDRMHFKDIPDILN